MGHTPYGYRIENGVALIDEAAANKLRSLYKNYLSGMSLTKAAAEAGIDTYHGTVKRLLTTRHYIGDIFYPAIIDEEIFGKAQAELTTRAAALGRINKATKPQSIRPHTRFSIKDIVEPCGYSDPAVRAEYIYSLIESEEE